MAKVILNMNLSIGICHKNLYSVPYEKNANLTQLNDNGVYLVKITVNKNVITKKIYDNSLFVF